MNGRGHLVAGDDSQDAGVPALSVEDSLGTRLLPFVLSLTAGSIDVIGFLGLDGLFTAHITGNLVVLAAKLVAGERASLLHLIAVPVFMVVLALTKLLAAGLDRIRMASLSPLLLLQFLLLSGCFFICLAAGPNINPNASIIIIAGMLGVSAMAVQNALVRVSLRGAPATAVMTTNVTVFTMDVGEMLLGRSLSSIAKARNRARCTWPAIAGFVLGCALGASCEAAFGLWSLMLPAGCAAGALSLGFAATMRHTRAKYASYTREQHDDSSVG